MADLTTNIPFPSAPFLRPDGTVSEIWWNFFLQLFARTGGTSGSTPDTTMAYNRAFAAAHG